MPSRPFLKIPPLTTPLAMSRDWKQRNAMHNAINPAPHCIALLVAASLCTAPHCTALHCAAHRFAPLCTALLRPARNKIALRRAVQRSAKSYQGQHHTAMHQKRRPSTYAEGKASEKYINIITMLYDECGSLPQITEGLITRGLEIN